MIIYTYVYLKILKWETPNIQCTKLDQTCELKLSQCSISNFSFISITIVKKCSRFEILRVTEEYRLNWVSIYFSSITFMAFPWQLWTDTFLKFCVNNIWYSITLRYHQNVETCDISQTISAHCKPSIFVVSSSKNKHV